MEEILVCRTGKMKLKKKSLLSMRESMDRIVNKIKSIFHEKCGIDKLNVEELLGKEKWEVPVPHHMPVLGATFRETRATGSG